jgi:hypothetical protein
VAGYSPDPSRGAVLWSDPHLFAGPTVCRLAAGAKRIRTAGPTSEPHLRRTVQAGINATADNERVRAEESNLTPIALGRTRDLGPSVAEDKHLPRPPGPSPAPVKERTGAA